MEERRAVHKVSAGKPEGKRALGRPKHRWENNNNLDLQKVECGSHGLDQASLG